MDVDIIRDQKLGVGAGMRSNKVCDVCRRNTIICVLYFSSTFLYFFIFVTKVIAHVGLKPCRSTIVSENSSLGSHSPTVAASTTLYLQLDHGQQLYSIPTALT